MSLKCHQNCNKKQVHKLETLGLKPLENDRRQYHTRARVVKIAVISQSPDKLAFKYPFHVLFKSDIISFKSGDGQSSPDNHVVPSGSVTFAKPCLTWYNSEVSKVSLK